MLPQQQVRAVLPRRVQEPVHVPVDPRVRSPRPGGLLGRSPPGPLSAVETASASHGPVRASAAAHGGLRPVDGPVLLGHLPGQASAHRGPVWSPQGGARRAEITRGSEWAPASADRWPIWRPKRSSKHIVPADIARGPRVGPTSANGGLVWRQMGSSRHVGRVGTTKRRQEPALILLVMRATGDRPPT